MQKDQQENLYTVTIAAAREHPSCPPVVLARNLAKMQRLAASLRKRYVNAETGHGFYGEVYKTKTIELETKAIELSVEIGVDIFFQRAAGYSPIGLRLQTGEQFLF